MTKFSMLKLSLLAAALTLASTLPSQAQTPGQARISVPFAFQVGTEHFAPGVYTVATSNDLTLAVRGAGNGAFASVHKDSKGTAAASSKVVFRRIGGQYFLSEVWVAGSTEHLVAYETKAEKQALKQELAANRPETPGVEIALAQNGR